MPRRSRTAHAAQPVWWGLLGTIAVLALAAAPAHADAPSRAATVTMTYPTGEYRIAVPPGVNSLPIVAVGGKGGDGQERGQERDLHRPLTVTGPRSSRTAGPWIAGATGWWWRA